ncbi:MAG: glycoside hydrolase family 25 protein [Lachnospiraceae bacterium]|jgi:GH25 family lysozyme M1 (1,4-beta-N-acetylmuramidase)|nr:glycoside hydrolase family 25 protein [Lachnospiraceae bacterium]
MEANERNETRAQKRRRIREEIKSSRVARLGDGNPLVTVVVCVIALLALTGCIVLIMELRHWQQNAEVTTMEAEDHVPHGGGDERTPSELDEPVIDTVVFPLDDGEDYSAAAALVELKERLMAGEDLSAILRAVYVNDVVVGADGRFHFFPIDENLAMHEYDTERFVLDDRGILSYQDEDGNVLSRKGIDVSRYQLDIDWEKVAADGVEFAIIRLGFRGSSEGGLFIDPYYEANIEGALANGIDVGVYFFTQALNVEEAIEEAEFVLLHIGEYDLAYPVVIDIEMIETANPRTRNMTQDEWTEVAIAFCEHIIAAGYTPMIYGNLRSFMLMLDISRLEAYERWFAFFRTPIYFPYQHSIWQYTDRGQVDGIEGPVDLNIGFWQP